MKRFCTECLQWTEWDGDWCTNCQSDFAKGWQCERCGLLYRPSQMHGDLCHNCSYTRPMCFPNWYPTDSRECYEAIQSFPKATSRIPKLYGGLVPHAGWYYSGPVASRTYSALASDIEIVVLLGAVHRVRLRRPCLSLGGMWETPLGMLQLDTSFTLTLLKYEVPVFLSRTPHETEHSIEVQLPFIRHYFPKATLVPIMVPPLSPVLELGQALAEAAKEDGRSLVFLASSDLTHYGRMYRYTDFGPLPQALDKVHEMDRRILNLVENLCAEKVVEEALTHQNACGPGALACALEASRQLGSNSAEILEYTTSMELRPREGQEGTVGYAAAVWGVDHG